MSPTSSPPPTPSPAPSCLRRVRTVVPAALAAGAALVLAACAGTAGANGPTTAPATVELDGLDGPPTGTVVAVPEGSLETALERLPGLAEELIAETGIPGLAVAVVSADEVLYAEGFGVRTKGEEAPIDTETVFQIASMSKPIGATVIASQIDEGIVSWDDPVRTYLPDFQLADPWVSDHVTIGDLYSHRSGLPHAAGDDLEDIGYDRATILERLRLQPLGPFRQQYAYANFGLTTGAEAVAVAAGEEWAELSERALYEPLGMDSTSSRYSEFLERENRATLHFRVAPGDFEPLYERDPDAQAPAGGVSSDIEDIATWMRLVLGQGAVDGEEIFAPEALLPAVSPQIVSSPPGADTQRAGFYGHGFNVGVQAGGRTVLSHSGAFATGAGTVVQLVPSLGIGIAVLTNAAPVGAAETLAADFTDLVEFGEITRDWLAAYGPAMDATVLAPAGDLVDAADPGIPPARDLADYAGTYTSAYFGDAVVTQVDGALQVALGPSRDYVLDLRPWDGDTFAFVPLGENGPEGSLSSAAFAADGEGMALTLDFFDGNGLGTWVR